MNISILLTQKIFHSSIRIIMSKSCKNAIKFNDQLSLTTMLKLINELAKCHFPMFCIHGRNTIYPLFEIKKLKE